MSEEQLIERVASAHRARHPNELATHPAWLDLSEDGRVQAHALATHLRELEAALDPDGLSTTARAVLARIRR